jgi:hypothetical protein
MEVPRSYSSPNLVSLLVTVNVTTLGPIAKMDFIVLEENQEKSASQTTTVIGCLVKGDQPGQFSITGEDGKRWDLRRSTVTLADHSGHQATVTGPPTREAKSEGKKAGQVGKAGKEELGDCASPVQSA